MFDARCRLLATVSVIGIMSGAPVAHAGFSNFPSGFWVSVDGDFLSENGSEQPLLKSGVGFPAKSDRVRDAWMAQLAVGGPLDDLLPGWDFRLAYTGIRSNKHRLSATGGRAGGSLTLPDSSTLIVSDSPDFASSIKQEFDIGDFDIGTDVGLGDLNTRLFGGARFVSFNQSSRASLLGGEGAVELSCSHFFGVGPRIGADASYPLGMAGEVTFDLVGDVDGSALFGNSYHKATVTSVGTKTPVTESENGNSFTATVLNADASLGIAMQVPLESVQYTFTAGYRAQAWWGVADTRVTGFTLAGTGGTEHGNQYLYGPFVDLSFKW